MPNYNAKVTVDYYLNFDSDSVESAEDYAWFNFDKCYSMDIYEIEIEEESEEM